MKLPGLKSTWQRSAISSVLSQASGRWLHSARISCGGLDVVAVAVELEALGVGHHAARGDAEQVLVGVRVGLVDVVGVVGRDRRDAEVLRQPQQTLADPRLDREPVVHQLEEEVVAAEDVLELRRRGARLVVVADAQPGLDLTRRAAGGADQALRVLREELAVGAGLVVLALEGGAGREPEQVVQAHRRLGQQRHVREGPTARHVVVAAVVPAHPLALLARGVGRAVGLQADDRLDPPGGGLGVELVGPEHVAVVGHGDRAHAELGGALEQVVQPGRPVEHGVLGVDVEVDEVGRWVGSVIGRVFSHGSCGSVLGTAQQGSPRCGGRPRGRTVSLRERRVHRGIPRRQSRAHWAAQLTVARSRRATR